MNSAKVKNLVYSQELCTTIHNNVNKLSTSQKSADLKKSIINHFEVLSNSLKKEFDSTSELFGILTKTSNIFHNDKIIDFHSIQTSVDKLISIISSTLFHYIYDEIKTTKIIDKSLSDNLLSYIFSVPYEIANFEKMALDICIKSSITNPLNAYNSSLKLIEKYPNILSSEQYAHPGYIFRNSEQRTFNKCPICQGKGTPFYNAFAYSMSDYDFPYQPFKLWMKCHNCSNLYTYKHPEEYFQLSDESKLITPDNDKYFSTIAKTSTVILSIWCNIINRISAYTSGKNILEVGVGNGELIAVALELGYSIDAVEILPSEAERISNMLNIPIWNGDFLNYRADKKYSIITMGDVIEHVSSPTDALKNAYNLLEDDGVLWLSTPNYESAFSKMLKFNDPMWCEPHHITYFSYKGLANLAENCGFKVVDYQISSRYNGSMELILVKGLDK